MDKQTTEHVQVATKQRTKINPVWWLPFIALLMMVFLAVNFYAKQGPLISISFATAEGLEVDKTKLRYKDVDIGVVEAIEFADDYQHVQVSVRMNKDSEGLLRENSRFWVVKPRIGLNQISGLGTLLSGHYITMDPDKNSDSDYRYEFVGLESPPVVTQDKPGLRLTLLTTKASSLSSGMPVYYKGMQVGSVDRVYFSDDYLWVKADIFIAAPHDALIKQTTKFYAASGVSIDAGANGFEIEMESITTLLSGGIAFETPISLQKDLSVTNGSEYILYDNKKLAFEQDYGKKYYYVTYFDGSVQGLSVGAPVTVQGMDIGKVKDIQLLFDEKNGTTRIPVLFEIYESRLGIVNAVDDQQARDISEKLVQKGLRTQLETANLLTGAKHIALTLTKLSPKGQTVVLKDDPVTGYPILPSVPQSFDALTSGVTSLINKVNSLPLEDTVANVNSLIRSADDKVNSMDLQQSLTELNALMKNGQVLAKDAGKTLKNLNYAVSKLSKSMEKTLSGFSPDAPLYYNLNTTLQELNETLTSLKAVSRMLERNPNALIFGEQKK